MFLYHGEHLIPALRARSTLETNSTTLMFYIWLKHADIYGKHTCPGNINVGGWENFIFVIWWSTLREIQNTLLAVSDIRHHWQDYILVSKLWRWCSTVNVIHWRVHGWHNYIISRVFNMGAPLRTSGNVPHGLMAALSTCITVVISGISKLLAACELNWYMEATILPEFCTPPTST